MVLAKCHRQEAPELYHIVQGYGTMVASLRLIPRVYIVEDDSPNAFATGSNPENAAVAATADL